MLDLYHLPSRPGIDVQLFNRVSTVTNTQWMTWQKPRGFGFAMFWVIGGAAGGGGGFTRAAGLARGGGGGGGSAGLTKICIPLDFLPDVLYVQVGIAGPGGAAGAAGGTGTLSYVSISPTITAQDIIVISGNASPTGGGGGTGAAAGAAGTAGTVATIANMPLGYSLGFGFNAVAGQAGTAGGAQTGAVGGAIAFPTTGNPCMGGTGGGGVTAADQAGGLITATTTKISEMRPINAPAGSNNGSGAQFMMKPFWSYSGMGGGGSNAGVGGVGGNGIYGSGGGGGGAGTTGGRGGDGGHGVVVIMCF